MNKIEQMHLNVINSKDCLETYYVGNIDSIDKFSSVKAASKCAEVTEEVAIEFAEWISALIISNYKSGGYWYTKKGIKTTNELLREFLKSKQ